MRAAVNRLVAAGRERPRADRPIGDLARDHRDGAVVKPHGDTPDGDRLKSSLFETPIPPSRHHGVCDRDHGINWPSLAVALATRSPGNIHSVMAGRLPRAAGAA